MTYEQYLAQNLAKELSPNLSALFRLVNGQQYEHTDLNQVREMLHEVYKSDQAHVQIGSGTSLKTSVHEAELFLEYGYKNPKVGL